eukprot:7149905-Prymnesium_polylepis.1
MVIALPVRARVHVSCQTGAQNTPHHARMMRRDAARRDATRCASSCDEMRHALGRARVKGCAHH